MTDQTAPTYAPRPFTMEPERPSGRWSVLAVMCLSLLLVVMDNTIVNVALPTLQQGLAASNSQLQWIVDAYTVMFAALLLTGGALGDRFGRRGALAAGMAVMVVGSLVSATSAAAEQLIAGRAVMGLGAAFVLPATLSIITHVFTDPGERGRAIAVWAGMAGAGIALGPIIGGSLLERFWYGSVFLINLPVIAVVLIAAAVIVPTSRDPQAARLDPIGALLSVAGIGGLVYAVIEAPQGWTRPPVLAAAIGAVALLAAFVAWERRVDGPMLPLDFFGDRRFTAGSSALAFVFFGMFGLLFILTQYLQFVQRYSPLATGVRLLPLAGVLLVVAPTSARLVERLGTRTVIASGLVISAAAMTLAVTLSVDAPYLHTAAVLVGLGCGFGLTLPTATSAVMGSAPPAKAGVAAAVADTSQHLGGALGVAVIGSMFAAGYGHHLRGAVAALALPAHITDAAAQQIGAALVVADQVGGQSGVALGATARVAFVDGMGAALTVAAAVALVGAAAVFAVLSTGAGASRASSNQAPQRFEIIPIGTARTPYRQPGDCPPQSDPDGPECAIEVAAEYRDALTGLADAATVDIVSWLHHADRDAPLRQTSGTHPEWGAVGVFALRTPNRPNPLGVSTVAVVRVEPDRLVVRGLDCLDGTPVVDLKRGLSG